MTTSSFNLPIYYLSSKEKVDENITQDLELLEINETSSSDRKPLLQSVLNLKSKIGKLNINKQLEYFTNDKRFLKQTQRIIKSWKNDLDDNIHTKLYDDFYDMWTNIREDESFIDKYYYVDIEYFKFLNNSSHFLQILSIYNLLSPVLSLLVPFILLLVPFFMLKFNGVVITMSSYYTVLTQIFSKHALGNVFNIMSDISWEKRIYAIVSVVFYFFSIYQNTLVCYRFYNNFKDIHDNLFLLKDYLITTIDNMNTFEKHIKPHDTYNEFTNEMSIQREKCQTLYEKIQSITDFKVNFNTIGRKVSEIGYIMKYFYEIHINPETIETIEYSLGLNAYIESMSSISSLHREKRLNKCSFGSKLKMKDAYYPYLMNSESIKNVINVDKNMIITGPNASGKTTILKTTVINLLFSQTYGYGFYSKATIPLYDKIHCYLNIPDTSGRDSLFQAEARRCKEIIDELNISPKKHFCIFDELFSGTNPSEACASSYGFIKYLIDTQNMDFILTTHLLDLCSLLDNVIQNNNMGVEKIDNFNFNYTYKLNSGISSIKGGLKVLCDLEYPVEILNLSNKMLQSNI
tara:strand:- start:891 stop:2615 length:1725 start_codon:yes stop_codon:yes gene_type:complete